MEEIAIEPASTLLHALQIRELLQVKKKHSSCFFSHNSNALQERRSTALFTARPLSTKQYVEDLGAGYFQALMAVNTDSGAGSSRRKTANTFVTLQLSVW